MTGAGETGSFIGDRAMDDGVIRISGSGDGDGTRVRGAYEELATGTFAYRGADTGSGAICVCE